jgi:G3E family GTPase
MTTEIYIVSGFLGAGKTTLIQKLLRESWRQDQVALLENDFGEVSVDAALLRSSGVSLRELNAGCICCTLAGDFVRAVRELIDRYQPDKLIIEPSGVAKLSDIVAACLDPGVQARSVLKARLTVVDVKRCRMYRENFGHFFEDQIQHADVILLSRTDLFPDRVAAAWDMARELNATAPVFTQAWDQISAASILQAQPEPTHIGEGSSSARAEDSYRVYPRESQHEGHSHDRLHSDHSLPDSFDAVTIPIQRAFSSEELAERLNFMAQTASGAILRAKGVIPGHRGYLNVQYLPGDLQITECDADGSTLCIIGRDLNRAQLLKLFEGA